MVDLSSSLCKRWPGRVPFLSINCQINPLLRWMISYFTFCYLPLLPGFKKIIKWQTFRQIATKIARQFADRIRVAFLVVTISYGALEMVVACRVDWHFFLVCSGHHSFRCPVDVEPSYPTKRVHFFCLVSMKHIPELKENWPKPWMKPGFDERIFHQIYGMAVVPNSHGSSSCCFLRSLLCSLQSKGKVSAPGFASAWARGDEHPHIGRSSIDHTTPELRSCRFFFGVGGHVGTRNHGGDGHFPNKERERARVSRSSPLENLISDFWYWISSFLSVILLTRNRICRMILFIQYTCYRHDIYIYIYVCMHHNQRPFPKLEVPTIYKANVRAM